MTALFVWALAMLLTHLQLGSGTVSPRNDLVGREDITSA